MVVVVVALSMVVIASMIGSRGLGEDVLAGIQTLDVGKGTQAGIAIVILAIVIDRISQGFGQERRARRRLAQQRRQKGVSRVPYRAPGGTASPGVDSNQPAPSSRA